MKILQKYPLPYVIAMTIVSVIMLVSIGIQGYHAGVWLKGILN